MSLILHAGDLKISLMYSAIVGTGTPMPNHSSTPLLYCVATDGPLWGAINFNGTPAIFRSSDSIFDDGVNFIRIPNSTSVQPVEIIRFENKNTPKIEEYGKYYADNYGQYPTVSLFVDGIAKESDVKPDRINVAGILDSLVFDIGEEVSGYIILKK